MGFAFLSSLFGEFMSALGASDRLFEILDRDPSIPVSGGRRLDVFEGHLRFKDVEFVYPSREDTAVLQGINLELQPGQVVALVGPSGGGKSTMVGMAERFYDPVKGCIELNGVDLRDLDLPWYRSHVGLVSQEPILFASTIKENILFGVQQYTKGVGPAPSPSSIPSYPLLDPPPPPPTRFSSASALSAHRPPRLSSCLVHRAHFCESWRA